MPVRMTTTSRDSMIARAAGAAWKHAAARWAALTIPMLAGACAAGVDNDRPASPTPVTVAPGAGGGTGVTPVLRAGGAEAEPRPEPVERRAITRDEAIEALGESPVAAVLDALGDDAKAFNAHVITLSNPFFDGRQPGTRGNALAADYIERYFRDAGLRPAFGVSTTAADGTEVVTPWASFRQSFSAGSTDTVTRQRVTLNLPGGGRDLRPGRDFNVLGCAADGVVTGPVVFVGYSIPEGPGGYAGYPGATDLSGRIALMLRFEPMGANGRSRWASSGWSPAAALDVKIGAAIERGAAGVILVNPAGADDPRADRLADTSATRLDLPTRVPAVMLTTALADELVRAADVHGRSLDELRRLADEGGVVIDLPLASASLETGVTRRATMTDNVGGVLPGRGALVDDWIIVGAHYDHVGVGPIGAQPQNVGKLHPGADDNASGTSGMLVLMEKLARDYAALPEGASARSIMFLAFSAEESGLNGSRHFVRHAPIPRERMTLMLNMDMIGRLRSGQLEVGGVGTAPGLRDWLGPFFAESGLTIKATASGFGPSDHASFAAARVPVLFLFTGLHREYHTPADVGSTINQKGAARVIGLAHRIVMGLATRAEAFGAPVAEGDEPAPQPLAPGPTRVRVRFGIAPGDYSGEMRGVLVGEVYEGTSAADAGITAGDIMTSWNGKPLTSVEAWMPLLAAANPGDVVEVGLVRGGTPMTVKVTLRARDAGGR